MELLQNIALLSQEFGTVDFVRGGGGNTSVKNDETLWVKPSGTTLGGMTEDSFLAMKRAKISELYTIASPADSSAREALVKEKMMAALEAGATGRPSVEAPLHNAFAAAYVVHTHPALVNGMTCSQNGAALCGELFPEALWVEYTDPGYTLSMTVKDRIVKWKEEKGSEPVMVFLKNHGVFVAANTPEDIRLIYGGVIARLNAFYRDANVSTELPVGPAPDPDMKRQARDAVWEGSGDDSLLHIHDAGWFDVAEGPISPDHIVYSKSYPFLGHPSPEAVRAFIKKWGYSPQVVAIENVGVFGLGTTDRNAVLALELAMDGALIKQLAEAFGGIEYLTDQARDFIDNWEVEAYRRKVAE